MGAVENKARKRLPQQLGPGLIGNAMTATITHRNGETSQHDAQDVPALLVLMESHRDFSQLVIEKKSEEKSCNRD